LSYAGGVEPVRSIIGAIREELTLCLSGAIKQELNFCNAKVEHELNLCTVLYKWSSKGGAELETSKSEAIKEELILVGR